MKVDQKGARVTINLFHKTLNPDTIVTPLKLTTN